MTSAVHKIRLHGPWSYEPLFHSQLDATGKSCRSGREPPLPGRVRIPADWGNSLGMDFRGRVRYTRPFHCPTGLQDKERVSLVIECLDAYGQVWLNDESLGNVDAKNLPFRTEITAQLQPRNFLTVEVELPMIDADSDPLARPAGRDKLPGGLIGEVRLEIE